MTRAGCWAHAKRTFVEAEKAHPGIAREVVALLGRLYAIERQSTHATTEACLSLRRERSQPLLETLHRKLSDWKLRLLPKHPMSEAMGLRPAAVERADSVRGRRGDAHRQQHQRARDEADRAGEKEPPLR